jgi:hypothetical protein
MKMFILGGFTMIKRGFLIFVSLALLPLSGVGAFDGGRIQSVTPIVEYLAQFSPSVRPVDIFNNWDNSVVRSVEGAALSPDGAQIAWYGELRERVSNLPEDAVCVHTFSLLETFCYLLPRSFSRPSPLTWSSDGRFVFFTEERIDSNQNTDVWVFDASQGLLINATNPIPLGNAQRPTVASFAPTWDAFNNRLFYLYGTPRTDGVPQWELRYLTAESLDAAFTDYRVRLEAQAQSRIAELEDAIAARAEINAVRQSERDSFSGWRGASERMIIPIQDVLLNFTVQDADEIPMPTLDSVLVGMVAGLPAGSQLIDTYHELMHAPTHIDVGGLLMLVAINNPQTPAQGGVWLIDLTSGAAMPMVSVENLITSEPAWIQNFTLTNVQWANDSTGFFIGTQISGQTATYANVYHFSLMTGALNPIANYGTLNAEADFFAGDLPTVDTAVLLPDDEILYFNRNRRDVLYAVPAVPPARGAEPQAVTVGSTLAQQRRLPSSIGYDGQVIRVLFDSNLLIIGR